MGLLRNLLRHHRLLEVERDVVERGGMALRGTRKALRHLVPALKLHALPSALHLVYVYGVILLLRGSPTSSPQHFTS